MKINSVENPIQIKHVSFSGCKNVPGTDGLNKYVFFANFDKNKYDAYIEIVAAFRDKYENWQPVGTETPIRRKLGEDGRYVFCETDNARFGKDFAYRFVMVDKGTKEENVPFADKKLFQCDPGTITNQDSPNFYDKYTVVQKGRGRFNDKGPMYHLFLDSYNPAAIIKDGEYTVDKNKVKELGNSVRNHANHYGGNFIGLLSRLPEIKKNGFTKILSNPVFMMDEVSSNGYWPSNSFRIPKKIGTFNEYKNLQIELFKNGIDYIADGAFTSESIMGLHLQNILKHKKDSYYYYWFKSLGDIALGNFPDKDEAIENVGFKVVNPEYIYSINDEEKIIWSRNERYDKKRPTYFQIFDKRLASDSQQHDYVNLIKKYDILQTKRHSDISENNDTTNFFSFEIPPRKLHTQVKYVNEMGLKRIGALDFINVLSKFNDFSITRKGRGSGFAFWDGNPELARLNFGVVTSDTSEGIMAPSEISLAQKLSKLKLGSYHVWDFIINVGRFWTKVTDNALQEHVAGIFKGANDNISEVYQKAVAARESGELPENLPPEAIKKIVENVLNDNYDSERYSKMPRDIKTFLMREIMDFPVENLEFSPNVLAVMASPYITFRPYNQSDIGKSRYDMYVEHEPPYDIEIEEDYAKHMEINNRMFNLYNDQLYGYIYGIFEELGQRVQKPINDKDGNLNDFGKYIIRIFGTEVTKFAFIAALVPDAIKDGLDKNGQIQFDKNKLEGFSLQRVGIHNSAKVSEEAVKFSEFMEKKIKNLRELRTVVDIDNKELMVQSLLKRVGDLDETSFKLADAITSYTRAGLGWRADASKDIANFDGVLEGFDSFKENWDNIVLPFWTKFLNSVKEINPNAYTVAEITDLFKFNKHKYVTKNEKGEYEQHDDPALMKLLGKYVDGNRTMRHFIEKTGFTTVSNYHAIYDQLIEMFSQGLSSGKFNDGNFESVNLMRSIVNDFSFSAPTDAILGSHVFIDNHDKSRILHNLSLDMELFNKDEIKKVDLHRLRFIDKGTSAYTIHPQGLAMAEAIDNAVIQMKKELKDNIYFDKDKLSSQLAQALVKVAEGDFLGNGKTEESVIASKAFGALPFEFAINNVFEEAKFLFQNDFEITKLNLDKIPTKNKGEVDLEKINIFRKSEPYNNKNAETIEEQIKAKIHYYMLKVGMEKYLNIHKVMSTLVGIPTTYAGDELGETGYETSSKNAYLQNRNFLHWQWLNKPSRKYIKDFYDKNKEINNLYRRPELSALSGGFLVGLPQKDNKVYGLFKYDESDSNVIVIYKGPYGVREINQLSLSADGPKEGLKSGLTEGTVFKNADASDTNLYVVKRTQEGNYVLECTGESTKGPKRNIALNDSTTILYKANPKKTVTFGAKEVLKLNNLKINMPILS